MQNTQSKFIYFCYNELDESTATPIINFLQDKGLTVYSTAKNQSNGEWASQAQEMIEKCEIFMPLITHNFIENDRCRKEVCLADSLAKKTVSLFIEKTPLKYGLALQLTAEQGIERWMHETDESFLNSLVNSPIIENLINSSVNSVTQSAFINYLLYAIDRGEISVNELIDHFSLSLEKALNIFDYMISCGVISETDLNGVSKVLLTEYGFKLLYYKDQKSVLLSQLNESNRYIFISYAHKNSEQVLSILRFLQEEKIRVWFDAGIEVGAEWPATIQQKINECALFMPMVTKEFVNSKNCRKEVFLADKKSKNILPVYLEECALDYGLDLQLAIPNEITYSNYPTDYSFKQAIATHPSLEETKADENQYITYDLFISAVELMLEANCTSLLFLQHKLGIPYKRATYLIDALIQAGIAYRDTSSKKVLPLVTKTGFIVLNKKEKTDILF